MVKQRGIAEEILQDTFLKIWNNIDGYSASRGRLFTWMFNVARNLAIDKLRSREIRKTLKTGSVADHQDYIDNKNPHQQQTDSIGIDDTKEPKSGEAVSYMAKGDSYSLGESVAEPYRNPDLLSKGPEGKGIYEVFPSKH